LGIPYLGIGPAAHSYYNNRRFWNVANNQQYIRFVEANENAFTYEEITPEIAYNELMLTRLRTIWGVSLDDIRHINSIYVPYFQRKIKPMIDLGIVDQNEESFKLTYKGKLMADYWTTELFL
jgi:oxygen-independent coproporphyrinogen-3 oxidase